MFLSRSVYKTLSQVLTKKKMQNGNLMINIYKSGCPLFRLPKLLVLCSVLVPVAWWLATCAQKPEVPGLSLTVSYV